MSARYTLRLSQDVDLVKTFFCVPGYPGPSLPAYNFQGCTALLEVRAMPTDVAALISVSTTPNAQGAISFLNGPNAPYPYRLGLHVTSAAIAGLSGRPWPQLWHDLLLTDAVGNIKKLLHGPVLLVPGYAHE